LLDFSDIFTNLPKLKEKFARGFGGETRRKETLRRYRLRWENNIKMNRKIKIGDCGIN
jgi:hypothetical protein